MPCQIFALINSIHLFVSMLFDIQKIIQKRTATTDKLCDSQQLKNNINLIQREFTITPTSYLDAVIIVD
jgi:hypothetical protein